jgi:hypothetical protein
MSERLNKRLIYVLMAAALIIALAAIAGCTPKETKAPAQTVVPNDGAASQTKKAPNVRSDDKVSESPRNLTPVAPLEESVSQEEADEQAAAEADDFGEDYLDIPPAVQDDIPVEITPGEVNIVGRLAIVIDDFGYRNEATKRILDLNEPITCAVLPDARTSAEDGLDAFNAGKLVILHMPMEAIDGEKSQGDGFIRSGMSPDEVSTILAEALSKVPMAKGVSNHMGSRVSTDAAVMKIFLEELASRGLFYLDSRTTGDTLGPKIAGEVGTKSYMNGLFIDSVDDISYVKGKLWEAAENAKLNGQAVAIGHVKSSTASALEEVLPKLRDYGIELVFLNELEPLTEARF